MTPMIKWALAVFFALISGSFGYTTMESSSLRSYIQENEGRLVGRLDRIEDKLDRVIERNTITTPTATRRRSSEYRGLE